MLLYRPLGQYTLERKVHHGRKYARAETFKLIRFHPRGVCPPDRTGRLRSCLPRKVVLHSRFYRSWVPIINPLSMPRICERRDSGEWQSPYTSVRKVHQGRKYARAETFKLICFHSRGVCPPDRTGRLRSCLPRKVVLLY